jgi:8-oxo-dGTP pyrophosphatase MutT (NUDIX family)
MSVREISCLDLDSVAALVFMGRRYLLQHRENRQGVSYAGFWGLFGGACEPGESASEALRRELLEEISLEVVRYTPILTCTYELWFESRRTRKTFFGIEVTQAEADGLVLGEGQGMAWCAFEEVMAMADRVVPYDLSVIALHHRDITQAAAINQGMIPGTTG